MAGWRQRVSDGLPANVVPRCGAAVPKHGGNGGEGETEALGEEGGTRRRKQDSGCTIGMR